MEYVFYYLLIGLILAAAEALSFKGEQPVFNLTKTQRALAITILWFLILGAGLFCIATAFWNDLIKRK